MDATIDLNPARASCAVHTAVAIKPGPAIHPIDLPPAVVDARRWRLKPRDRHASIDVSTDTPT